MNKVLGFIKGNLVIVISVVLILAFLPTGYIFASKWNAKVHARANDAYTKEKRALTSAGSVNYALPAVLAGETDLSESRAPNDAVTRFYAQAKSQREQQVDEVVSRGTEFNRGDHVQIVDGLLPKAPNQAAMARLGRAMTEAIVGTASAPSVYQRKLSRLNAGSPPDAADLAQRLSRERDELTQQFQNANADGKMTEAQQQQLASDMVSRRLASYIGRAKSLTFYCSPAAFVNGAPGGDLSTRTREGDTIVPAAIWPPSRIDESVVFNWLWDYWVISDVLDAAALANTSAASGARAIPEAPVKRIELIRVSAMPEPKGAAGIDDDMGGGIRGGGRGGARGGGIDDAVVGAQGTITGRTGGQPNSPYDIRTVRLVAVVASKDLPAFIDALGRTNYMTVTDLDLSEVDVWGDLQQGYYYGDEHVVRVSMEIESVWLRSWMARLMPDAVKTALGVPLTTPASGEDPEG